MHIVIKGQLRSKSNSRQLVIRHGQKPRNIKNPKALEYEEEALWQLKRYQNEPFSADVRLDAHIYYPSRRQDLDDTLLCDILQKAGIITNDRLIIEKHLYRHLDKENPRVELDINYVDTTVDNS